MGNAALSFLPAEAPKPARMNLTLITLDRPTADFAAVFTRNALPGAPVIIGRQRLAQPTLSGIVINNKVANVCAPGGVAAATQVADKVASALGFASQQILPCSTGVIGWGLPVDAMLQAVPAAVAGLQPDSVLPAAESIMTTDLYPKIRSATVGAGRIVGIAKGAGMVEPNMATMLVFLLTDLAVPRADLRHALASATDATFNAISVDSDTSTSDTVVLLSSGQFACPDPATFNAALREICRQLADDVVRNGEGIHHVMRVQVTQAPTEAIARGLGKAVVNSPLFKCAVAGNDPNVGRLVMAVGKYVGVNAPALNLSQMQISLGGHRIFSDGVFHLDAATEAHLVAHFKSAELYATGAAGNGVFRPPVDYPPHDRCIELQISLGAGLAHATVLGGDLTHEYISENADYRS